MSDENFLSLDEIKNLSPAEFKTLPIKHIMNLTDEQFEELMSSEKFQYQV